MSSLTRLHPYGYGKVRNKNERAMCTRIEQNKHNVMVTTGGLPILDCITIKINEAEKNQLQLSG